MSLSSNIQGVIQGGGRVLDIYESLSKLLKQACQVGAECDPLGPNSQEGLDGYIQAARYLYGRGYYVAGDSLLVQGWNQRAERQSVAKQRVYRASLGAHLADSFLARRDEAAALRWALLTQADDLLGRHCEGGGAGKDQLRVILGMSSSAVQELEDCAQENLRSIETPQVKDWSQPHGFPEDLVLRFVLKNREIASRIAQESSVNEFPLCPAYLKSLIGGLDTGIATKKGKWLEDLACYLFLLIPGCIPIRNVVDARFGFESDVVVRNLNQSGHIVAEMLGRHFLAECKNWNKRINVQQMGYFLYRMHLTRSSFGIIFAKSGITGDLKAKAAEDLRRRAFQQDNRQCIIIDRQDLRLLREEKTTFWALILEKTESVRFGKPRGKSSGPSKKRRKKGHNQRESAVATNVFR